MYIYALDKVPVVHSDLKLVATMIIIVRETCM